MCLLEVKHNLWMMGVDVIASESDGQGPLYIVFERG